MWFLACVSKRPCSDTRPACRHERQRRSALGCNPPERSARRTRVIGMTSSRSLPRTPVLVAVGLLAVLVWAYWTTLGEFHERWAYNAQYSHGYLVPLFAGALLWLRRDQLVLAELRSSWWALP